jgi:hypothetical protein
VVVDDEDAGGWGRLLLELRLKQKAKETHGSVDTLLGQ